MAEKTQNLTIPDIHQTAFELYHSLGNKRTYKAVAAQLGVSERTVRTWAKRNDWRQRISERDVGEARRLADQTMSTAMTRQGRNSKIVEMALVRLARGIADGKVRMHLADIERLIRLQAELDRRDIPGLEGRSVDEVFAWITHWLTHLDKTSKARALALFMGEDPDRPSVH
jgi:hypothetical protein